MNPRLTAIRLVTSSAGLFAATAALALTDAVPAPFAQEVLGRQDLQSFTISSDGSALYLAEQHVSLMRSRSEGGRWSEPEMLAFSRDYTNGDPCISPDGRQLFFWSTRPIDPGSNPRSTLWVCDRTASGWGDPRPLPSVINDGRNSAFPSVAANGTLYFFASGDIYRARRVGDTYAKPEKLGDAINTPAREFDAYIAPDESFLIFSRAVKMADGSRDKLFLSRRREGDWATPRELSAKINFDWATFCPALSPDRRWFFFTSAGMGGNHIYQIDARALGLDEGVPPADVPDAVQFAPGGVVRDGAFGLTIAPDGTEACFAETRIILRVSRLQGDRWSAPVTLPFAEHGRNVAPCLSRDGRRLYFLSDRRAPDVDRSFPVMWYVDLGESSWGEPRRFPVLRDSAGVVYRPMRLAFAASGAAYFTGVVDVQRDAPHLYRAPRAGDGFGRVESLGVPMNGTNVGGIDLWVAADEGFVVFSGSGGANVGRTDLYLTRRDAEGRWSAPQNLGPSINSTGIDASPCMSDGERKLLFLSSRSGRKLGYEVPVNW